MIKLLSIVISGVAALWLSRGYSLFVDKRLGQMRGIIALARHIHESLGKALTFGSELYRDFSDSYLESCGLLPLLRKGTPPAEALSDPTVSLNLPEGTRERLAGLFSSLGRGYLDGELARLTDFIEECESELKDASEALEKNKGVTKALIFGAWSSLAIILI